MRRKIRESWRLVLIIGLLLNACHRETLGQETATLFPSRSLFPEILAGPRDPGTSVGLLGVTDSPNSFGEGVELEVSIGSSLPLLLLPEGLGGAPVVLGIEAAVFARFGFQRVERELVATDWLLAVPVYWLRGKGWYRFRYFHTSSHMGDEYARRFEEPGINFSRDAAEVMAFRAISPLWGIYGGLRVAYIVHPEESKRWVMRGGTQLEAEDSGSWLRPFAAADLEWDQDAGDPRIEMNAGVGFPRVGGGRSLRLSLTFLSGPSPLGQFNGKSTSQFGLSLRGNL